MYSRLVAIKPYILVIMKKTEYSQINSSSRSCNSSSSVVADSFLAKCSRPSVCRLSVTFVHHTPAIEVFGNISIPFGALAIC